MSSVLTHFLVIVAAILDKTKKPIGLSRRRSPRSFTVDELCICLRFFRFNF